MHASYSLAVASLLLASQVDGFSPLLSSPTTTRRNTKNVRSVSSANKHHRLPSWGLSMAPEDGAGTVQDVTDDSVNGLDGGGEQVNGTAKNETVAVVTDEVGENEEDEDSTIDATAVAATATIETEETESTEEPTSSLPVVKPAVTIDNKDSLLWLQSLGAISGRGEFASPQQKQSAAKVLKTLEDSSPIAEPAKSPAALGRWELVYAETHSFRASPFFLAGRAVCTTQEQAEQFAWFCDMHRAALAVSQIRAVRQIVSETKLVSEFEVSAGAVPFLSDLTPFAYSGGLPVFVTGAIVSSADATPTGDGSGWELFMDTVEIKGSNLPGIRQILDQGLKLQSRQLGSFLESNLPEYSNPLPVLSITYLDEMFRISRDQDGNAYCYIKTSESSELTDYASVDADLGVARLLEGFNDAVTKFYL